MVSAPQPHDEGERPAPFPTWRDLWIFAEQECSTSGSVADALTKAGREKEAQAYRRREKIAEHICEVLRRCEADPQLRERMAELKRIEIEEKRKAEAEAQANETALDGGADAA